jgi:ubiquitin thioesterase protein OTUB1
VLTSPIAIAFSYFETLLRIGDKTRIVGELARLKSLNNLLNQAGFAEHLYEDFVAETIDLLSDLAYSLPPPGDDTGLLKAFNDAGISSAIITHFRVRI